MFDLIFPTDYADISELDLEMRLEFGPNISGISCYNGKCAVHFFEQPSEEDEAAAQAIINNYDPVEITGTRTGSEVLVTFTLLRNPHNLTEIVFTVDGIDASPAVALSDNVGHVTVTKESTVTIGLTENGGFSYEELQI